MEQALKRRQFPQSAATPGFSQQASRRNHIVPYARPTGLTVEKIDSVVGLRELEDEWEGLVARCPHRTPFLTHAWMMTWWKHFGQGKELCILVVREERRVVMIAPLMRYRGYFYDRYLRFPVTVIEGMANYHSNRMDLIYAEYRDEVVRRIWESLLKEEKWHLLRLYPVPADSPTVQGLRDLSARRNLRAAFLKDHASPYLTAPARWDEYARGLSRRITRKVRLAQRSAGDEAVTLELFTRDVDVDAVLRQMFRVAGKSWAAAEETAFSSTEQLRGFYTELSHLAGQKGWPFFCLMKVGAQPVAFEYNLCYHQTIYNMVISFDPAFAHYGPGHVIKHFALSQAFGHERGIRQYDFLGDAAPYKLMWTQQTRPHVKICLYHPGTVYGKLLHLVQSNLVQPAKDHWWRRQRM